ncbi:hypothetical protein VXQ18_15100 [Brucella abortus]|nr:hypothetical protein [Brucella abortus]
MRARAARTARTMQKRIRIGWQISMDDQIKIGQVDARAATSVATQTRARPSRMA